MDSTVIPVFDVSEEIETEQYDTAYRKSIKWDFEKGDFVRDGAGRLVECDGKEAYMTWCYKVAQTERYVCLAYPDSIGTELEIAIADDDEKIVESMVKRTITDALMVNPRTEYVNNFEFQFDTDAVHCSFEVKGVDWDEVFRVTI